MDFVYDFLNVSMQLVKTNFVETLGAEQVVGEVLIIGDNDLNELSSHRNDGFINSVNLMQKSFSVKFIYVINQRRILTGDTDV